MSGTRSIFSQLKRCLKHSNSIPRNELSSPSLVSDRKPQVKIPNYLVSVSRNLLAKPVCASLECLPPEVRRYLLSILELEELRTLVNATPVFHQQYLLDRRFLLRRSLESTLGCITADACAVYRSGLAVSSNALTNESVLELLNSYRDQRSSADYSVFTENLSEKEIVDIVTFYFSVIDPLARCYTSWALANLADETKKPRNCQPLSRTEKVRLVRALYRFQLCCNLFGKRLHGNSGQLQLGFRSVDILRLFFCIFEPWEVEEIACVYAFSKENHDRIFDTIRWDVHEKNPKFDGQRPPTPKGAFDFDNSWTRQTLLKGTISHGLELLYTVLTKIKDHTHLVSTMQEHISWGGGDFLEDALGETAQFWRRRGDMSDRDLKQQRRDPLPFRGDSEDGLYPPVAWTLIWNGTYSNLYGHYVQDVIRRWGYVMWDATRLEQTSAKEVLARQWEEDWGGEDPRCQDLYRRHV